jgi:hypothetical protein
MVPGATTNHALGNRNGGHYGSFNSALDAWGSDPDHHPDCSFHALSEGSACLKTKGKMVTFPPNTNPPRPMKQNTNWAWIGLAIAVAAIVTVYATYRANDTTPFQASSTTPLSAADGPEWRGAWQSAKSSISARADRSAQYPVGRGARCESAGRNAAGHAIRSWREQLAVVSLYSYSMLECT